MNAKVVNPFILSATSIFKDVADIDLTKGQIEVGKGRKLISGYGVVIGITGGVHGQVLYELPTPFAESLTELLNEKKREEFSSEEDFISLIEGTINEIGNMISGQAVTLMSVENIDCDITPPTLLHGKEIQVISRDLQTIMVPFTTKLGYITINIAITA